MITVTEVDFPVERVKKIQEWLMRDECGWVEEAVRADIAALQAEATNESLERPQIVIADPVPLSPEGVRAMKEAAVLACFLGVLGKLKDPNIKFTKVELKS